MRRGTRRALIAMAVGAGVIALAALRYGPATSLALALAVPSVESWRASARAGSSPHEIRVPVGPGRALDADLYRPAREAGSLLLVHGLSPAGRRHPELGRLARALSDRGQLVLVPHFEGLAAFRLSGREVEDVRGALSHLRRLSPHPPAVAGFSFGAGPALIAAAGVPDLRQAGSFGGYADLRNVLVFITTGAHGFEGRRESVRQEEYNRWKLLALLTDFVPEAADRAGLASIARRRLANPADDTRGEETRLGEAGRAVLALVANRREEAVPALLDALPTGARQALGALSPLPIMPRLAGRLLIAHGAGDESIPYTESLRLAAAAGPHERAIVLETFHHVGPRPWWPTPARLRDAGRLVRLADALLTP